MVGVNYGGWGVCYRCMGAGVIGTYIGVEVIGKFLRRTKCKWKNQTKKIKQIFKEEEIKKYKQR